MTFLANNGRLKLSIEHKEYEGPVSFKIIAPAFEWQIIDFPIFAIWVFDIRFLRSQIQFFMQAIQQER